MLSYDSIQELADLAAAGGVRISQLVLDDQCREMERTPEQLYAEMAASYQVMREAAAEGIRKPVRSASGLSGGTACQLNNALSAGILIGGRVFNRAVVNALAISEVNAGMGRIVAAPTAGSCGILPAVLLAVEDEIGLKPEPVVMSLFTAAAIGLVIAGRASLSGAEGGCQAECGSAAAMAAGALVELMGGTPQMVAQACAIALKNVLGLVCDPVAGLVEIPCVKRNASGAANAILAANLALAGIESAIPADEVIDAMRSVGNLMAAALRETAEGGLAATPTGCRLAGKILGPASDL
ncbi:MAG TPA: L-serine ammonia-lyase, iron-sulfur-dependent, subunit alpha [Clostridiales bacterium]|nr:L-serine ammonia-lyase, iron-sulfur-dependent, subunit alpha [Clostridiales bacterium]